MSNTTTSANPYTTVILSSGGHIEGYLVGASDSGYALDDAKVYDDDGSLTSSIGDSETLFVPMDNVIYAIGPKAPVEEPA